MSAGHICCSTAANRRRRRHRPGDRRRHCRLILYHAAANKPGKHSAASIHPRHHLNANSPKDLTVLQSLASLLPMATALLLVFTALLLPSQSVNHKIAKSPAGPGQSSALSLGVGLTCDVPRQVATSNYAADGTFYTGDGQVVQVCTGRVLLLCLIVGVREADSILLTLSRSFHNFKGSYKNFRMASQSPSIIFCCCTLASTVTPASPFVDLIARRMSGTFHI